jgi:hypothetical protein
VGFVIVFMHGTRPKVIPDILETSCIINIALLSLLIQEGSHTRGSKRSKQTNKQCAVCILKSFPERRE